jgi:hypothetical protein
MLNMMEKRRSEGTVYDEGPKKSSSSEGFKEAANMMMSAIKNNDVDSFASSLRSALKFVEYEKEMKD